MMLKSTHKASVGAAPLPEGWTAHKAPTGHTYYYNAATKQSTYTRPTAVPDPTPSPAPPSEPPPPAETEGNPHLGNLSLPPGHDVGRVPHQHLHRRHEPQDRPKAKQPIPGAEPWVLVRTKLGRRFVYNPELNESFWKFPSDVLKCVVELDRKERVRRERRERGEPSDSEADDEMGNGVARARTGATEDSDEYEEVEVTDDEDENSAPKRPRIEEEKPQGPVEFNEDDIAYQLAAMGQEDDFDDYDEGEDGWEAEEEEMDLADANALFHDLLDDFRTNPYTPWETIIEEGKIIEDDRYLCLPNMRSRKEAWEKWSHDRIQQLKEDRARQEKKDPRIPYMAFLQSHATPKLYWPEFKRKYRKESAMRDSKLTDKEREKWYREHINRLKLPESSLKSDLTKLLKSLPLRALNRSTSLDVLPSELLTDIRYISLFPEVRDPLIQAYISIQPPAPDQEDASPEEVAAASRKREERDRREKAFQEREKRVEAEKRQRDVALRASKGAMKAGEEEIRRAMKVGKTGLLGHLEEQKEQESGDN